MGLRSDFFRAIDETDTASIRAFGPPPGIPPATCRYCGKWWRKWAGSKLDGHSKCIVPDWFKRQVREAMESDPTLTYQKVGEEIGLTASVIRSWISPIATRTRT